MAYQLGQLFPIFLLLAGFLKCLSISRRETTSAKCVLGLALLLGTLLLITLLRWLPLDGPDLAIAKVVMGFAAMLGIGASVLLSILGLIEYRRADPPFRQGRKQAITTLVLGSIFLGAVLYSAAKRSRGQQDLRSQGAALNEAQTFEEYNLHFAAPPPAWSRMDLKALNEDVCLAFQTGRGTVVFMLIAERMGIEQGISAEQLAAISRSNVLIGDKHADSSAFEVFEHLGMDGRRFRTAATIAGRAVKYEHHVITHNGYAYQLIAFAPDAKRGRLRKASQTMLGCFRQIDPSRTVTDDASTIIERYESARFGYSVELPGSAWYTTDELRSMFAEEDMVVAYKQVNTLSVIPIQLGEHVIGDEAALESILDLKSYEYPDQALLDRKAHQVGGRSELSFAFEFDLDGSLMRSECRFLRANGLLYLVQAIGEEADASARVLLRRALFAVTFSKPKRPVAAADLAPREKRWHAWFFNQVGLHFYRQEAYEVARGYFLEALSLDSTDVDYVSNACQAMIQRSQHFEALRLLSRHQRLISKHLGVRGDRAWLLSLDNQEQEAMTEYRHLFEAGLRDRDDLKYFVALLTKHEKSDEALRCVADYRAKGDSPMVTALHADLLCEASRGAEAVHLLDSIEKPLHPRLARALIKAHRAVEDPGSALLVAKTLLESGYESADMFLITAQLELATEQPEAALRTVEQGLLLFADDTALQGLRATIQNELIQKKK